MKNGPIRLRAFAKVNYALEVRGLREDGYHDIATVMQSVSLADELRIERAGEGFDLAVEPPESETGPPEDNTIHRAWKALREFSGLELPVKVGLRKRIPSGAGLGGGSADAAAFLLGMNDLYNIGLDLSTLREIGNHVGADVPFCLSGGTALAGGTGDVLTPLPPPPPHHLVLVKPSVSANTGHIYRAYDESGVEAAPSVEPIVSALRAGALPALVRALGNALASVTRDLLPEVERCERDLLRAGALGAMMSGSGSAVFGIFVSKKEAENAKAALGLSSVLPFVEVCEPINQGTKTL